MSKQEHLTSQNIDLLEELTVAHLVKVSLLFRNPKILYLMHKKKTRHSGQWFHSSLCLLSRFILLHVGIRKRRFPRNAGDRCLGNTHSYNSKPLRRNRWINKRVSPEMEVALSNNGSDETRYHYLKGAFPEQRPQRYKKVLHWKSVMKWPWPKKEVLAWPPLKIVEIQLVSDDCKVWLYKRGALKTRYILT
jgi:hypothetical protein